MIKRAFGFIFVSLAIPFCAVGASAVLSDGYLQVNYIAKPIGLDAVNANNLRFSWRTPAGMQTAYQIQVSNGWDSGKVTSSQQNGILYKGTPFAAKTAYTWKVKLWIDNKESDWREASFETGILSAGDWKGNWVGSGPPESGPDGRCTNQFNRMRQAFSVPAGKTLAKARAYVAAAHYGRGLFGFHINGQRPVEAVRLLDGIYTFDVTSFVKPGENALSICFGDTGDPRPTNKTRSTSQNLLLCDLDLWFTDGSRMTVASGADTHGAQGGAVITADEFDGESYDARNESPWREPGFDSREWRPCTVVNRGKPTGALLDRVQTVEIMPPVAVTTPKPGMQVFDVGTQISGVQILNLTAKAGVDIQFRFAERLNPDGTIDRSTILKGLPAEQIDHYITREGAQSWEPELTWHGFRYMEMTGFDGPVSKDSVTFRRIAGDIVAEQATFTCSNESLNRIHQAFCDTQLANAVFTQTDCNQRGERAPWAADAFCVSEAAMSCFDMSYFWQEKWINIANSKVGAHGESNSLVFGGCGGYDMLWGSHCVRIPWDYWNAYGDKGYLAPGYERSKKFADCCINWYDPLDEPVCGLGANKRAGEVLQTGDKQDWLIEAEKPWRTVDGKTTGNPIMPHGDWMRPDGKWMQRTSFINSATYYLCVRITAQMAEALGKSSEASHYYGIAGKIRDAINGKWLVEKGGATYYMDNDQTPNAMALHYNIVADDKRAAVTKSLVEHIRQNGNHLTTGAIGTLSLIPALSKNGRDDVVFDLAVQKSLPSWIGMLDIGPGTFWEHWTEQGMSKCHPFLGGSITAWLYQVVAGIRPLTPGYETIEIRPNPVGDVTFCKATIPTVRGMISTGWKIEGSSFKLDVDIPGNTTAQIGLPGENTLRKVGPGHHSFSVPVNLTERRELRNTASAEPAPRASIAPPVSVLGGSGEKSNATEGISSPLQTSVSDDVFILSFFRGNGQDGIFLAASEDGLTFTSAGRSRSWLKQVTQMFIKISK